jgi:hypothetical protein
MRLTFWRKNGQLTQYEPKKREKAMKMTTVMRHVALDGTDFDRGLRKDFEYRAASAKQPVVALQLT